MYCKSLVELKKQTFKLKTFKHLKTKDSCHDYDYAIAHKSRKIFIQWRCQMLLSTTYILYIAVFNPENECGEGDQSINNVQMENNPPTPPPKTPQNPRKPQKTACFGCTNRLAHYLSDTWVTVWLVTDEEARYSGSVTQLQFRVEEWPQGYRKCNFSQLKSTQWFFFCFFCPLWIGMHDKKLMTAIVFSVINPWNSNKMDK